jgi:hypothetical protein
MDGSTEARMSDGLASAKIEAMDRATEQLWRTGQPPFDGLTIYTDLLPTPKLIRAAAIVVDLLARQTPCRQLQAFEDWHEHDGYNQDGVSISWADLRATVDAEDRFREMSPEDDYVRRAWLPDDASFYLRWMFFREDPRPASLIEPTGPAEGGDLDLSASAEVISEAAHSLAAEGIESRLIDSVEFFNSRWAG